MNVLRVQEDDAMGKGFGSSLIIRIRIRKRTEADGEGKLCRPCSTVGLRSYEGDLLRYTHTYSFIHIQSQKNEGTSVDFTPTLLYLTLTLPYIH